MYMTKTDKQSPPERFEVTRGDSNRSLKNYGFLYDAIFSSHVRMRTNHLATKCNYYVRLLRKIAVGFAGHTSNLTTMATH